MTNTYAFVDDSDDPENAADWQDRINRWPAIAAYKRIVDDRIGAERPVLDVGCGTGLDLARIGPGSVGVDRSMTMARRARGASPAVAIADAAALPFADSSFAGARTDRVLQHLPEPERALDELARVVRPGGIVAVADPDQGTLVIELPWVRPTLVDAMRRDRRDRQYRNGSVSRKYAAHLAARGFVDISVDATTLVLTDPDDAFGFPTWMRTRSREPDGPTPGDVEEWEAGVERARHEPGFVYAVSYLVTSGRRAR
jgi:SAM-dependent methyltransferase